MHTLLKTDSELFFVKICISDSSICYNSLSLFTKDLNQHNFFELIGFFVGRSLTSNEVMRVVLMKVEGSLIEVVRSNIQTSKSLTKNTGLVFY
jgi:hypothetical protein